jgi:hypothetical protein
VKTEKYGLASWEGLKMSLDEILKVKKEIMDMIYNVGFIFLVTPFFTRNQMDRKYVDVRCRFSK